MYVYYTGCNAQEQVDKFSDALLRLGMKKGDRLGIWMPNCVEWVVAQFATAKTGIILVFNLFPSFTSRLTLILLTARRKWSKSSLAR